MDELSLDSLSLVQRLSLLSIAAAVHEGEGPVDSREVREQCSQLLDVVDAAVLSKPTERDMMRALSALGSESYVDESQPDQSPTGKGRPTYSLAVGVEVVLDRLAEDDRLVEAVERVRE